MFVANAQSRALDYVKEKYAAGGHFWITSSHFDTWVEDTLKVYLGFFKKKKMLGFATTH